MEKKSTIAKLEGTTLDVTTTTITESEGKVKKSVQQEPYDLPFEEIHMIEVTASTSEHRKPVNLNLTKMQAIKMIEELSIEIRRSEFSGVASSVHVCVWGDLVLSGKPK